jgi:hypothetical protein
MKQASFSLAYSSIPILLAGGVAEVAKSQFTRIDEVCNDSVVLIVACAVIR